MCSLVLLQKMLSRIVCRRHKVKKLKAWLLTADCIHACMCETNSITTCLLFMILILLFSVKLLNNFLYYQQVWIWLKLELEPNRIAWVIYWCTVTTTSGGNVPPNMVVISHHTCVVDNFHQNRWLIWDNENPPILVEYFHHHFYSASHYKVTVWWNMTLPTKLSIC